jgi:two-component system phosphate regulon sensor histidine kinase PhoR
LRYVAAAAAGACVAGAFLTLTPLRPLGVLLCLAAAAGFAWTMWREQGWRAAEPVAALPAPAVEPKPEQMTPVLEGMPDPALLIDADGRIAASNAASRRMLGFATSGLRLSAVLRRPELLDAADAAARDGASLAVDYEVTAPVEEHFRVFFAPVPFGGRNAALMVFHDQTTSINTERMRVDFLANASHELRTPLASLTLLIETLSGHAKDDPTAHERFLNMMHVQADRMRDLIDDLLSLSKIELNEHVPPSDQVDLVALTREVIDNLTPLAQGRGLTLNFSAETNSMPIIGDRLQLLQVAQNLIDNAIKYSPKNASVQVELGLGEDREEAAAKAGRRWPDASRISLLSPPPAAGRRYAFLRVGDEGPGIARRHLPRLSERFYRVEREEGAERGGTGLGLAIVKHIVNRHRGGLIVESLPGKGSAFAVYFERPSELAAAAPVPASTARGLVSS